MSEAPPSFAREKIIRLRAAFVASLPGRLVEARRLHLALFDCGASPKAEDALALHRVLHSLKGTGSSFGLLALAEHANRGEMLAIQLTEDIALASPAAGQEIAACLERLDSAVLELTETPTRAQAASEESPAPAFEMKHAKPQEQQQIPSRSVGIVDNRLVYLCDDDALQVEHLAAQLQCFGYQTQTFSDPATLQAAIRGRRPGAVVMDIIFPEGDCTGTDTVLALNQGTEPPIPTIFISARHDFDARLRAVRAGGGAYFAKPVDPLALVSRLDTLTVQKEPEPYRVLIVDDEPAVANYHALILQEAGMTTRLLHDYCAVLSELDDFHPDLVLMDMYMPQCTGRELAQVIRQMTNWVSLPILFLSSETDKSKQFSAMRVGAEGFLTKPVQPAELVTAVAVRSERMRHLRSLMVRDSLTGLYNHTTTSQMLANALAIARRKNASIGFAMIDVDRFKLVNDTYGHIMGDQVLVALSRILRERLRKSDIIGRYGGEEFAVIMQDVSLDDAHRIIDNVRIDFSQVRFHHNGVDFNCSFSGGVALSTRDKTMIMLRGEADRALYQAKHDGRNRIIVAS